MRLRNNTKAIDLTRRSHVGYDCGKFNLIKRSHVEYYLCGMSLLLFVLSSHDKLKLHTFSIPPIFMDLFNYRLHFRSKLRRYKFLDIILKINSLK